MGKQFLLLLIWIMVTFIQCVCVCVCVCVCGQLSKAVRSLLEVCVHIYIYCVSSQVLFFSPTVFSAYQSSLKFVPKCFDPSKDKDTNDTPTGMNQTFVPRQRLLVMLAYDKKVCSRCHAHFTASLFLVGNLGRCSWVRRSSCKSSATHSSQGVPYFPESKPCCGQCLGFSMCMQMLMHVIAHGGFTNTVRESALKVDWEKNPFLLQGLERVSVLYLAFQLDALSTELSPFPHFGQGLSQTFVIKGLLLQYSLWLFMLVCSTVTKGI